MIIITSSFVLYSGKRFIKPLSKSLGVLNGLANFRQGSKFIIYHWSPSAHKINTFESMPFRHLQSPVTANCHGTCTIHGLRKTLRTWLAENGVNFEVAEACLAHEEKSAVVRAYQKYDYFDERMQVMTQWGDALIGTLPQEFKELMA